MADAIKNFADALVATAPSPATSGTSLTVTTGYGARFPAVPFNAAITPANTRPSLENSEIVRVTNIAGDVFTITRAQESTTARTVIIGDNISVGPTEKTFTDLAAAIAAAQAAAIAAAASDATTKANAAQAASQPLATVLTNTTAAFTSAQETKLSGIEAAADVTDAGNIAPAIVGATAKTTPVDADGVGLIDSAAANVLKFLSWANLKATLKTYFDTLYNSTITFGTGVLTALGVNVGSAGSVVVNGGALGTPSSGAMTNLSGTSKLATVVSNPITFYQSFGIM